MSPKLVHNSATDPIVKAICKAAEAKGLKAYKLAQMSGMAINTVQRLLSGTGSPTLATLRAVCGVVGLELTAKAKK